ncbi:uncharacterized protein LOC120345999 isoform X2 [Styela clava]
MVLTVQIQLGIFIFVLFSDTNGCSVPGEKEFESNSGNIVFDRKQPYQYENCEWVFPTSVEDHNTVLVVLYNNVEIKRTFGQRCTGEIWLQHKGSSSLSYMLKGDRCGSIKNVCHIYWKSSSRCRYDKILRQITRKYPDCSVWLTTDEKPVNKIRFRSEYRSEINFNISFEILTCAEKTKVGPEEVTDRGISRVTETSQFSTPSIFSSTLEEEATSYNTVTFDSQKSKNLRSSHRTLAILVSLLSFCLLVASGIILWLYFRQKRILQKSDATTSRYNKTAKRDDYASSEFGHPNVTYTGDQNETAETVYNELYGQNFVGPDQDEPTYSVVDKGRSLK